MCSKIKKGGGKNGCGQGSKWGGIKFWEFFKGGIKICPRHVHNALTRMKSSLKTYHRVLSLIDLSCLELLSDVPRHLCDKDTLSLDELVS